MAIFDAAGKLLERYDLSQANSSENIDIRASASAAIRKHFVACPELLHALEAYENPEKADPEALLHFFEQAKGEISCK